MKNFIKEFKEFAVRGNVVDLAVGIMIGSAFSAIVTSLVNDIIMPLISAITNLQDFSDLKILLATHGEESVYLNYGNFIQVIVNFLIIAFSIFVVVKGINSFKKKEAEKPAEEPVVSDEVKALREIVELLKQK